MKKLELFQCEVCGTRYANKDDCQKCEKGHKKDLHIAKSRYLPFTQDRSGMPISVAIMGPNGEYYTYKR